ncbi:hypothetical protein AtDm6_0666 [Acetobacter tropicalis]|uniref:Uncharacterized protein n=1 Tax=Acetobacter tropicalis TaxID=104102 RepID=A0A094ZTM7_9PROT|nr:hypothetical protein AtDm6_0666 [Acetobacter tropicalis]
MQVWQQADRGEIFSSFSGLLLSLVSVCQVNTALRALA